MTHDARYDMLELVLLHRPGCDPAHTLASLQDSVEPRFEVEPLELWRSASCFDVDRRRQVVRIASVMGECFDSAAEFDAEVRDLAGGSYSWTRVGAIRAGQTLTVRG